MCLSKRDLLYVRDLNSLWRSISEPVNCLKLHVNFVCAFYWGKGLFLHHIPKDVCSLSQI